ncbi:MAG: hypothetical protein ACKPKO_27560 [Candidatus Fonsibacter sp.]
MPDSFPEAGVLDNDHEHFWNIMIGEAEVQAHLGDYMTRRLQLERYAHWPRTPATNQQYAAELKVLAKDALQHLLMLHDAYRAAEAEVFGQVALIIVTPDMALHLLIRQGRLTWPAGDAAHET